MFLPAPLPPVVLDRDTPRWYHSACFLSRPGEGKKSNVPREREFHDVFQMQRRKAERYPQGRRCRPAGRNRAEDRFRPGKILGRLCRPLFHRVKGSSDPLPHPRLASLHPDHGRNLRSKDRRRRLPARGRLLGPCPAGSGAQFHQHGRRSSRIRVYRSTRGRSGRQTESLIRRPGFSRWGTSSAAEARGKPKRENRDSARRQRKTPWPWPNALWKGAPCRAPVSPRSRERLHR